MPGTFLPPCPPSFVLEVTDEFGTISDQTEMGVVVTRARWSSKRREFKLAWENADQSTRDYLNGFMRHQLGGAANFSWALPVDFLYEPKPAVAPVLTWVTSGALGARTYYVAYTFSNSNGETEIGPEASIALPANNVLIFRGVNFTSRAIEAVNVYAGTVSGSLTLQTTLTESGEEWQEPDSGLVAGASPPTVNGMAETVQARMLPGTLTQTLIAPGIWNLEVTLQEVLA